VANKNQIDKKLVISYWDNQPCNINHSKQTFGSIEYFNEVEQKKYFVEPHIPKFAEFQKYSGKNVLEIGCGIGTDAVNFVRAGANYTGIELSYQSLQITKERFKILGLSGELLLGDSEDLETVIHKKNFDLIYSFGVLHHTPDLNAALKSIKNVSSPSTEIKIMVYAKNSYKQALIDAKLMQPEAQTGCPIANSYTKSEIFQFFEANNLTIESIEQCHIFPYEIAPYRNNVYKKLPWFEVMPDEIFNALESELGWHLLIRAKVRT
jgi:2-polyprenyl-3-methyl-5-hydroxy-6-metoxy-1,4-benzoquinol methylase